jgi:hypothetical protein
MIFICFLHIDVSAAIDAKEQFFPDKILTQPGSVATQPGSINAFEKVYKEKAKLV